MLRVILAVELDNIEKASEKDRRILNATKDIIRSHELYLREIVDNDIGYVSDCPWLVS